MMLKRLRAIRLSVPVITLIYLDLSPIIVIASASL